MARRGRGRPTDARPTSSSTATTGTSSRGPRRASASRGTPTGCSRSACAKATPSRSSATSRVEWALFDFALGSIGAIAAPIYANSSAKDAGYIVDHSESIGILCEDEAQRAKVDEVRGGIPRLQHVLTFADLDDLAARGRAYAAEHPDALREAREAIEEDDLFTYIYTSGTTGPPKGCMISHRNYYAMVAVVDDLPSFTGPEDTMLLYLPLAHNFGRLMHLSGAVRGLRDRVPARPAAGGGGAARGAPDRLPERAARLREGPHRGRREVRRGDRACAASSWTGRSASAGA